MSRSPSLAIAAKGQEIPRITGQLLGSNTAQPALAVATGTRDPESDRCLKDLLFELGVEPTVTVQEAATILRWSYWKARRYFCQVEGICVSHRPKRYKRPYRVFTIPVSIFAREWQKMTGQEPEAADAIRHRVAVATRK